MPTLQISARDAVSYDDSGGPGPLIVLVHGSPGTSRAWQPVAERLAARFRVIAPNLPGYGGTTRAPEEAEAFASTQALLTDAETAYQAKATALTEAKSKLVRARQDMEHAGIEEQRAAQRAETARAVAGLSASSGSGINVALDAMTRTATQTRDRAAALDMKAKALTGAKAAEDDPVIAAAMAEAAGKPATTTVADRLAALQQRQ